MASDKHTVDYFPFFCKEGKAMFYIESIYGNDGFATWIKILRSLATTNHHFLDLGDKTELMFLQAKCHVSDETILKIINDLVDLGEFDKELWTNYQVVWSQKFYDSVQYAYSKRKNNCTDWEGVKKMVLAKKNDSSRVIDDSVHGKSDSSTLPNRQGDEKQQTKLNKTKEKKTKLNERKENQKRKDLSSTKLEQDKLAPDSKKVQEEVVTVEAVEVKQEKEKVPGKRKRKPSHEELMEEMVMPFDSEEFKSTWMMFLDYKRKRRSPYTSKQGMQAALKKCGNYPEEVAIQALIEAMSNNWQGFFPDKIKIKNGKQQPTNNQEQFERLRAKAHAMRSGG